ncbi:YqiA/YcfP family alpha/beta fold hydrolase [Ningiella sp. W23]|uniref:YqiA/YcfP family alpha/beta fold hydrolase n=1 Tax=Ningiella sp. W23 TaxID=3023715 RepID=UPI003756D387
MQHLIYLHGFLSSPQSEKAQLTLAYCRKHFPALSVHTPQLSGNIDKAVHTIEALVASLPYRRDPLRFIGSSMGGFLSTYFVDKYSDVSDAKAVIVNPAVKPYELLTDYTGAHINPYSQERFFVTPSSIDKLHQYDVPSISNHAAYKVLLQTGDETLDYRQALKKYAGADICLEEGGDHSFVDFQSHLPSIFRWLLTTQ